MYMQVQLTRQGLPYSECTDTRQKDVTRSMYEQHYNVSYTAAVSTHLGFLELCAQTKLSVSLSCIHAGHSLAIFYYIIYLYLQYKLYKSLQNPSAKKSLVWIWKSFSKGKEKISHWQIFANYTLGKILPGAMASEEKFCSLQKFVWPKISRPSYLSRSGASLIYDCKYLYTSWDKFSFFLETNKHMHGSIVGVVTVSTKAIYSQDYTCVCI